MMYAYPGKPLKEHLLRTAERAEQLSKQLKLKLDREAYLAGLFHDVGKADWLVQLDYRLGDFEGRPGYEVVSAVVAYDATRGLRGLRLEQRFEIVLAILRHRQAMRSPEEALAEVGGPLRPWFTGQVADQAELEATLKEGLARFKGYLRFTWPESYEELEKRVREMQRVFEKYYSSTVHVLRARLLSGLINIADTHSE